MIDPTIDAETFKPSFEDRTPSDPKTRTYRARLWTGIYPEDHTLSHEFQRELDDLRDEYYARHPPSSPEARCLVDQIIMCEWHLRRFYLAEECLWLEFDRNTLEPDGNLAAALRKGAGAFGALQHRVNSTRRALHNAIRELERLEARDRDVEVITPDPDAPVNLTPPTHLSVVGSLRKTG